MTIKEKKVFTKLFYHFLQREQKQNKQFEKKKKNFINFIDDVIVSSI